MLFNSPGYLFVFLPLVVVIYFLLGRLKTSLYDKLWILSASLFFYAYWNWIYLFLIGASISINYFAGRLILQAVSKRRAKVVMKLGIAFNLGLLAYYKYADFLVENTAHVIGGEVTSLNIVLPLAISFFTFQQIAYLVDCQRGEVSRTNFLDYSIFVSFFPQLIAGPIVHHHYMMPQFAKADNAKPKASNLALGITIFAIGLFKKVCIADTFAVWANAGYADVAALGFLDAWVTSLSYTFQLYYDFSGYADMAIGAGLLLNIKLPINFNSPYKATSIQDFWRRWHITLSTWLRDYVYISFGGNRKGTIRTASNILITFLLGGLWHGAGWTFVIWGGLHGIAMVIQRIWQKIGFTLPVVLCWFITFVFVHFAWVFFRAESLSDANLLVKKLVAPEPITLSKPFAEFLSYIFNLPYIASSNVSDLAVGSFHTLVMLLLFAPIAFLAPNSNQLIGVLKNPSRLKFNLSPGWAIYTALLFIVAFGTFLGEVRPTEFLYFNF